MSVEIRVPEVGESIVEAIIGKWLKQEGDTVSAGEPVVELETEKVNLEVTAPQQGVLDKILKPEKDMVTVGEVLGIIAEEAATAEGAEEVASEIEVLVSPLARRIAERHGIDLSQVKGTGRGGRITQGDVEGYLSRSQEREGRASTAAPEGPRESRREEIAGAIPRTAPAEGVHGRAPLREDAPLPPPLVKGDKGGGAPEPGVEKPVPSRDEDRVRLSRRRQTIARRLVEAHQTAVMATTYNEIDMSAVMDLRNRRRTAFKERHGVDLGFMSFFVKAVVGALKAFPQFNAELEDDELVLKYYYDIGIAVGSAEGLVVPVLRNADKKTFAEVEAAIADMVVRTEEHKLTLAELQGGTFTITNGGVFGSLLSTPILNPPQVGILGMHRIIERPVAVNGEVVIRPMMYAALTYDHRAVDGRDAVQFLVRVRDLVEDPTRQLLEV